MTEAQTIVRHALLISDATFAIVKAELRGHMLSPAAALLDQCGRLQKRIKEMRTLLPKAETLRRKVALERSIKESMREWHSVMDNIYLLQDAISARLIP